MASLIRQLTNLTLRPFSTLLSVGKPSRITQKIQHTLPQQTNLQQSVRNFSVFNIGGTSSNLLNTENRQEINVNQVRNYKAKDILRLRCKACYFVRRHERLFVECKLKGRHKQMQKIAKWKLYKDDYSKGNVIKAAFWNYHRDRYYKVGEKDVESFDWFADKIGKTV